MNNQLIYLLEVSIVFAVLYTLYFLIFRQLTFYKLNRILLLLFLPLSFIIPALNIGLSSMVIGENEALLFDELLSEQLNIENAVSELHQSVNIGKYLLGLYWIGLAVIVLKLVLNAFKLILLKRKSTSESNGGFQIILADVHSIFSCFNWIFVPQNKTNTYDDSVIEHERVHARLWHTFDLILTEIFVAFLWFNPFVFFFRKTIRTVHEFQADAYVLKGDVKKSHYLELLLKNLETSRQVGINSYFNSLTIKNRVKMITTDKSNKLKKGIYLLLIPVLILLAIVFSAASPPENNIPKGYPLNETDITRTSSVWGKRIHPIEKVEKFHKGYDFVADKGTSILATASGIVVRREFHKGYGNLVAVKHNESYTTLYAQMSDFNVVLNQKVKKGDVIGYVGSSGRSTGPHLHYEVRKNGEPVNPANYLK